ncbi:serine--tRNA ligase [Maledivibacter halophilus]|uniref:Serine--tRNA ligase n=1 Tax=Maledivibacter halophilus TaxID=36842 RepID=A0A1T5MV87_9FIRM|nr:serine--tRNA ligase [Maledivibacter halophilus]SKC92125.1 seryl-tRNA synthetase [Maledivibacter halophilus]
MLDIKRIRNDFDNVKELIEKRTKGDFGLEEVIKLDEERRGIISEVEDMKNRQNTVSKEIPRLKKEGKDASSVLSEMKELSVNIKELDSKLKNIEEEIKQKLLTIPNTPHKDTPVGNSDEDNLLIKTWREPTKFDFEEKAHWDVGTDLGILDFERASKITGTRFTVYKGLGAKLERALINFMLDIHTGEHGFEEILPPFMVNRDSMIGTGQLPKFEDDMFHLPSKDYFLIPTAEVPVTNLYMNEIIEGDNLPIYHTAYTPCFRKEAGSAGRDTRGLIRQHQFNKVELVKFVRPEDSYEELESLLAAAEKILQKLELPYRVVRLCGGDLGFSSAMTYDIEVWMPSYGRYLEISSCSNFEDYQARRSNIRFRPEPKGKATYVHTLNGSGLAVGRTFSAILENYQMEDGSVLIPEVLRPYMGGLEKITIK